jgi:hypothetical protein
MKMLLFLDGIEVEFERNGREERCARPLVNDTDEPHGIDFRLRPELDQHQPPSRSMLSMPSRSAIIRIRPYSAWSVPNRSEARNGRQFSSECRAELRFGPRRGYLAVHHQTLVHIADVVFVDS